MIEHIQGKIDRQDHAGCVGAYAADADEQAEECAFLFVGESEEVVGVFTYDFVQPAPPPKPTKKRSLPWSCSDSHGRHHRKWFSVRCL